MTRSYSYEIGKLTLNRRRTRQPTSMLIEGCLKPIEDDTELPDRARPLIAEIRSILQKYPYNDAPCSGPKDNNWFPVVKDSKRYTELLNQLEEIINLG